MRTTVDLPDDLHTIALSLSRDLRQSLSATIADLVRRGLLIDPPGVDAVEIQMRNGFPVVTGGRRTTSEDVRALDDP